MPTLKIDDKEYDVDSMSQAAKQQLQSLQFVEAELVRLGGQTAVFQTARIAYVNALKQALEAPAVATASGNVKFS